MGKSQQELLQSDWRSDKLHPWLLHLVGVVHIRLTVRRNEIGKFQPTL